MRAELTLHKKALKFTAWRLRNGLMNATDSELEAAAECCEDTALYYAGLLLLGLVAEVALAIAHPAIDSFWERWGSVIANVFVTIGVGGEVLFGRMSSRRQSEIKRRSDIRVSAAEERAADALARAESEKLARVKIEQRLAPRSLSLEQAAALVGKLSAFTQQSADIAAWPSEVETESYLRDLRTMLTQAGWFVGLSEQATYHPAAPGGIVVGCTGAIPAIRARNALITALLDEGIYAVPMPVMPVVPGIAPPNRVVIVVGSKPDEDDPLMAPRIKGVRNIIANSAV